MAGLLFNFKLLPWWHLIVTVTAAVMLLLLFPSCFQVVYPFPHDSVGLCLPLAAEPYLSRDSTTIMMTAPAILVADHSLPRHAGQWGVVAAAPAATGACDVIKCWRPHQHCQWPCCAHNWRLLRPAVRVSGVKGKARGGVPTGARKMSCTGCPTRLAVCSSFPPPPA